MSVDLEFSDVGKAKCVPTRRGKWVRRLVVYPLLALSGCHMLMTGSPIPLWHIEVLQHPVAVASVTDDALVLADGRRVHLPFLKRLPRNNPTFALALTHGVEVGAGGEVFGLIDLPRMCGNDAFFLVRKRANLSDLAGLVYPEGIDDARVHPDTIADIKETSYPEPVRGGMPYNVMGQLRRVRSIYESSAERAREQAPLIRSFSLD